MSSLKPGNFYESIARKSLGKKVFGGISCHSQCLKGYLSQLVRMNEGYLENLIGSLLLTRESDFTFSSHQLFQLYFIKGIWMWEDLLSYVSHKVALSATLSSHILKNLLI